MKINRRFFWIGFIKSAYINFRLFPFKQAIKFPILVTRNTSIHSLKGKAYVEGIVKTAMIRFGFLHSNFISWKDSRTHLNIDGVIVFKGNMGFGVGCRIEVTQGSKLTIGGNTQIGSVTKIICRKEIEIGENFRAAWETQIMDSNFHYLKSVETGEVKFRTNPIVIGKNNWLGNRSSILQGTRTPDFTIISSFSFCNKDYAKCLPPFSILGGTPARLLKTGYYRVLDKEEKEIEDVFNILGDVSSVFIDKGVREK